MGWKIYWAIWSLMFAFGAFGTLAHPTTQPLMAWVNLPMDALALTGVFGFAFQKTLLRPWVWQGLWRTYIVMFGLNFWQMYDRAAAKPINGLAMTLAGVVMLALYAPTAWALWRYEQRIAQEPHRA